MTSARTLAALLVLSSGAGCAGAQRSEAEGQRQVRLGMAEQMARRGDWAGAFQVADALHREDPTDPMALLMRGKALRKQAINIEAESDVRQVLKLAPRYSEAHAELALLCEANGRRAEAMEHHEKASELSPGNPRYLNNLAFALLVRGKAREAVPLFEEALRGEPSSPRLRNNLGFALAATGEFGRAAEQFRLAGDPVQARNNLGFAYERAGNLAQAFDLYRQAMEAAPGDARPKANLQHVAQELGRPMPDGVAPGSPGAADKGGG